MKFKIAWDIRNVKNGPATTDLAGFYPYIFGYNDGTREEIKVKRIADGLSHEFYGVGESGYARVTVWETQSGELRIVAKAELQ